MFYIHVCMYIHTLYGSLPQLLFRYPTGRNLVRHLVRSQFPIGVVDLVRGPVFQTCCAEGSLINFLEPCMRKDLVLMLLMLPLDHTRLDLTGWSRLGWAALHWT